jgi:hypothetical protein
MENQIDLSHQTKSRIVVNENSYNLNNLTKLEELIDISRGPANWSVIRESWVVSELVPGLTRVFIFEDGFVKEFRGNMWLREPTDVRINIQIEVIDNLGDLTCVDVMMYNGESITHLNLAERMSYVPKNLQYLTGIEIQSYYRYNQQTIDVLKQHMITDYVIQNLQDTYERQVRRYVRVKINEHSIIEKNVADQPVLAENMECEVKDVEEQSVVSMVVVPKIMDVRLISCYKKLCFISMETSTMISRWGIPMYFHYAGGFKIMFYSLKELLFRIGIGTILDEDNKYDVVNRVKIK